MSSDPPAEQDAVKFPFHRHGLLNITHDKESPEALSRHSVPEVALAAPLVLGPGVAVIGGSLVRAEMECDLAQARSLGEVWGVHALIAEWMSRSPAGCYYLALVCMGAFGDGALDALTYLERSHQGGQLVGSSWAVHGAVHQGGGEDQFDGRRPAVILGAGYQEARHCPCDAPGQAPAGKVACHHGAASVPWPAGHGVAGRAPVVDVGHPTEPVQPGWPPSCSIS